MIFNTKNLVFRVFCFILALFFTSNSFAQTAVRQQFVGAHLLSPIGQNYSLPELLGYKLNADNPLQIEFLVNPGDTKDAVQENIMRSVNYFLAALTTPMDKIWVNLSPYEADRVIDSNLEATDMGRDLLAQDYVLKQLAASLTNPETQLGKAYWSLENRKSKIENNGDLSKLWISPDNAEVYDQDNLVLITEASLKVESQDNKSNILIPAITKEVNNAKNFARLRQIYKSLILAQTFKAKFYKSIYMHYINKGKINGIAIDDKTAKDKIYNLYVDAFKKGAYNITKKEYDTNLNRKVKKSYFCGGIEVSSSLEIKTTKDKAKASSILSKAYKAVVNLLTPKKKDDNDSIVNKAERVIYDNESIIKYIVDSEPMTVLIADDNDTNRVMFGKFMEKLGHTVIYSETDGKPGFKDGQPAYDYIENEMEKGTLNIGLIITDNDMIDLHGHQFVADVYDELKLTIPCVMQTETENKKAIETMQEHNIPVFWPKIALTTAISKYVMEKESSSSIPAIYKDSYLSLGLDSISKNISQLVLDDKLKLRLAKMLNEPVMDFYYVKSDEGKVRLYAVNIGDNGLEIHVYSNNSLIESWNEEHIDSAALYIADKHNVQLNDIDVQYNVNDDIVFVNTDLKRKELSNFTIIDKRHYSNIEQLVINEFGSKDLSDHNLNINIVDALLSGRIFDIRKSLEFNGILYSYEQDYQIFRLMDLVARPVFIDSQQASFQVALYESLRRTLVNRKNLDEILDNVWLERGSSKMFEILREYFIDDMQKSGVMSRGTYDYSAIVDRNINRFLVVFMTELSKKEDDSFAQHMGLSFEQWLDGIAPVKIVFNAKNGRVQYDSTIIADDLALDNVDAYFSLIFDPISNMMELDWQGDSDQFVSNKDALISFLDKFNETRLEVSNQNVEILLSKKLIDTLNKVFVESSVWEENRTLKSDFVLDVLKSLDTSSSAINSIDLYARVTNVYGSFRKLDFDGIAYEHDLDVALGDKIYKSSYFLYEYENYQKQKLFALIRLNRVHREGDEDIVKIYRHGKHYNPQTSLAIVKFISQNPELTGFENFNAKIEDFTTDYEFKFSVKEYDQHVLISIDKDSARTATMRNAPLTNIKSEIRRVEFNNKPLLRSDVGGINMRDFAVTGISSSSVLDGIEIDSTAFENINPTLVSYAKVDNVKNILN